MLDIPAFIADKNALERIGGKEFILLLELEYADGEYLRWFRSPKVDETITFEGVTWTAFGFGEPARSAGARGEIPTFVIPLSNAGQAAESVLSHYVVEGRQGRLVIANREKLSDSTAKHEEWFTIAYADSDPEKAAITCSSVTFDPLRRLVPSRIVTRARYPGVAGTRSRLY